ncbi:MAG: polysaccharide biosynthesis/export family protein [Paracoccaceae bacterium]
MSPGVKYVTLAFIAVAVASCGLPRSGPNKREIFAGSVEKQGDAFIVTVNQHVTRATAVVPGLGFSSAFSGAGLVGSDTISPGDTLAFSIYENVNDGLLAATPGQKVSVLEEVQVDGAGFIYVPYAGRIKAAGNTPESLRQAITRKLDSQTPDPQVSITRVAGDGSAVTVSGSVGSQGVYPIERPTRTLASMLARAGGATIDPEAAQVTVMRQGRSGKIWLQDLYDNPALDIALRPGDRIVVQNDTRSFTVLGATGAQSVVPFETQTISAIEAIAQVGGLNTNLADPTGVFVFRNEPEDIARTVLARNDIYGEQRMVYVLDLTEPTGMFEARDFVIRDGDTLYVTEAPYVQWQKTLAALTGSVGAADSLSRVGSGS